MDGRFQQHQSDSFSIANLLSMQPKHNHHHPHRVIHPDPLSHLRKLTILPDAAETNALLAIHHQQQQHYHHHHPPAPPYFCNNPAIPSTSGHPSMMTPPGATASQPEAFKVEESMMISSEVHHQTMETANPSNESLQNDPASIDSADSGKRKFIIIT